MKTRIENLISIGLESLLKEKNQLKFLPHHIQIERTRDQKHGDFACNIAMVLAKSLQTNPRKLAEEIIHYIPSTSEIQKIEIAGPGFINFYLTDLALQKVIAEIIQADDSYGQSDIGQNQKVIIEFVSSNPTGPLHVGH